MEKSTLNQVQHSLKSLWIMSIYFILSFYYLGVVNSIHASLYPEMSMVHQNFNSFIITFNAILRILYSYTPLLMLMAAIAMLWYRSSAFPLWAIWLSILLCLISVSSTFFIILPLHSQLLLKGFNTSDFQSLMNSNLYYQIIPSFLQVLVAIYLLHIYLKDTKFVGLWIFIIIFSFSYFTLGSTQVEGFINYPLWLTVDTADWIPFRAILVKVATSFILLIVAFLPLLLIVPMFWYRPKGIPKILVAIYGLTLLWVLAITIIYFVPNLQIPLDKVNTKTLIEELMINDFRLRIILGLGYFIMPVWMLIKIGNLKINENFTQ